MDSTEEVLVLEVEEVSDALVDLLLSFGLSEEIINRFLENQYTLETLQILERKKIEELIPPPFLAERTKCVHGLNVWRVAQGFPPLSTDCLSTASPVVRKTSSEAITRERCTANYLLTASTKGRAILQKCQKQNFLTRADKKAITHLVVDDFKDRFGKLTPAELQDRASELGRLFPGEPEDGWYQPTFTKNSAGRKIKLRKQAKGRLYDRNINYREPVEAQQSDLQQPSTSGVKSFIVEEIISKEQEAEYQQTKAWFLNNQDEWEEVKQKWKTTSKLRTLEVSRNPNWTCASILAEYPTLRNHQGYQLVQIDFLHKFPAKETLLFNRWPELVEGIRPIFNVEVTDVDGKHLLAMLDDEDVSHDTKNFIVVSLLAHILPSPHLTCSGKRRWKPSILETRQSVVLHINDLSELNETLRVLFDRSREKGIQTTPFILVHGDLKKPTGFLVWNNIVSYKLPNFLKALDICLKIYKAYNIDFPRHSLAVWDLLSTFLFDFDPVSDKATISALCAAIRQTESSQ
ncbi:uncharacterized protein LOC110675148 [Aedes aegypti]|uniref:Uncharacterized protein n=1 Tax=Aedes aegypti TaxID=7159 RepID=A0A6I8U4P5_AEDAE|nr:uncharacterized protein LOC110675148 [Aedes aegypti]